MQCSVAFSSEYYRCIAIHARILNANAGHVLLKEELCSKNNVHDQDANQVPLQIRLTLWRSLCKQALYIESALKILSEYSEANKFKL